MGAAPLADALISAWHGVSRSVWDGETVRLGGWADPIVGEWRPNRAATEVYAQLRLPAADAVRVVGFLAALRDERAATAGRDA